MKVAVRGEDVVDSVNRYLYVIKRFQPDISIFFIRHPVDNWASLDKHIRSTTNRKKPDKCHGNTALAIGYGWRCGTPNGKLTALEHLYRVHNKPRDKSREFIDRESGGLFDLVVRLTLVLLHSEFVSQPARTAPNTQVRYPDLFVARDRVVKQLNSVGFPLELRHWDLPVSPKEVLAFARQNKGFKKRQFGLGGIRGNRNEAGLPTKYTRYDHDPKLQAKVQLNPAEQSAVQVTPFSCDNVRWQS